MGDLWGMSLKLLLKKKSSAVIGRNDKTTNDGLHSLDRNVSWGTSLVVQWLGTQCRGPGFDPWSGN